MKNEQVLELAQKNKDRGMEFEQKESVRSSLLGAFVAVVVGISLFLVEYFVDDSVNVGFIAVGMTASGVQLLYEGIKNQKIFRTIFGTLQVLIALFAIVLFVGQAVLQ